MIIIGSTSISLTRTKPGSGPTAAPTVAGVDFRVAFTKEITEQV